MLLGLRTAIYPVTDLAAAKQWYGQVLGAQPYFDQPFYVGFSVGGFELGLLPQGKPGTSGFREAIGARRYTFRSSERRGRGHPGGGRARPVWQSLGDHS